MSKTEKVLEVLNNRGGFDDWWGNLDEDLQNEIYSEIEAVIENDFQELTGN